MKQIWLLLMFLPIMGCSQLPVEPKPSDLSPSALWQERRKQILSFSDWSLSGRLSIKAGMQTQNASFFWYGSPDKKEVKLLGPFGDGRLRLYQDVYGATIQDGSGEKIVGKSAEKLLLRLSAWPIPFAQMNYWVLGLPDLHKHSGIALDYAGRARSFVQDGWKVEYTAYDVVDGVSLPKRINISSMMDQLSVDQTLQPVEPMNAVSVKLSISSWRYSQSLE